MNHFLTNALVIRCISVILILSSCRCQCWSEARKNCDCSKGIFGYFLLNPRLLTVPQDCPKFKYVTGEQARQIMHLPGCPHNSHLHNNPKGLLVVNLLPCCNGQSTNSPVLPINIDNRVDLSKPCFFFCISNC